MSLVVATTPVTPGAASVVDVQVTNDHPVPTAFVLRAVGLADDWVDPATATDVLAPGASVVVPFVVRLPHGFPISRQSVAIVAEPLVGGEADRCSFELLVGELDGVAVELRPTEVRGGDKGRFAVHLDNHSPEAAVMSLEGLAPEGRLRVAFDRREVLLPGGASVVVRGRLRGGRPFAGRARRLPFAVRVGGAGEVAHLEGGFTQRPVLSSNGMRFAAIIVVLALWVGLLAVGLDRITGDKGGDDLTDAEVAAQVDQATDTTGADGAGGTADGSGGAADGSGGGTAGGADPSAEVTSDPGGAVSGTKVGGTVQASDPGGVTVRVAPVPLGSEAAAKAALVDIPDAARSGKRFGQAPAGLDETRTTTTDPTGQWAFEGLRGPAYYMLTFSKDGYKTRSFVVQAGDDGEPIALDVILEAGSGVVSGVVVDTNGTPIGGADVTVTDGTVVLGVRTASTGADVGVFTVEGLTTPGTFLVTATRSGYGAESASVDLGGSSTAGGIVLRMTPGVGSVRGVVLGSGGEPRGNLTVTASNDDGSVVRSATTLTEDPVGTYLLPQLPIPGTYLLTVEGDGFSTSTQSIEVTGDQTIDVQLQATSGQVSGVVTDQNGVALSGVGVTLSADGIGFKNTTVDNPPGAYELDGIPPGTYVATFQRFGFRSESSLVTVAPGQSITVNSRIQELPPAEVTNNGTIHAVLSTSGVKGIPGGTATIVNAPPGSAFATTATINTSAAARTFDFTELPPGVYRIRIDAQLHELQTITVNVPPDQTVNVAPVLVPYATASGFVLSSPSNVNLDGATVTFTPSSGGTAQSVVTGPADANDPTAAGFWKLEQSLPAGQYTVTITHPDHVSAVPQAITVGAGETRAEQTNSLVARQTLDVTIKDIRADTPIAGARLRIYGGNLTGAEPPSGTAVATCGSLGDCDFLVPANSTTGLIHIVGLNPGTYTGYATADGYVTGRFTVVATDSQSTTRLMALSSSTGDAVTGLVQFQFDADPTRPVVDATVTVSGVYSINPDTGAEVQGTRTTRTNSSGGFTLPFADLPVRGNATVTVTHPSFDATPGSQPIVFDPTADTSPTLLNPVRLIPKDNTVSGQVRLEPWDSSTEPTVTLLSAPTYASTVTGVITTRSTEFNANGQPVRVFTIALRDSAATATVPEVRPGTYRFRVTATDYGTADVSVVVPVPTFAPANPATFTTTTIKRNGVIEVAITSVIPDDTLGTPQPVQGASVTVTDPNGVVVRSDTTPANGTLRFTGLPPGVTYTVQSAKVRFRPDTADTFLLDAGDTHTTSLEMQSLGAIVGSVRGEDGSGSIALDVPVTVQATLSTATFTGTDPVGATGYTIQGGATAPFGLDNGTWSVVPTTTVTGYGAAAAQDVLIDVTNRQPTADFVLPALPGDLFGNVTVSGGGTAEGVLVEATPLAGGGATRSTNVLADGTYRIEDLRHGSYTVRFSGTGVREVSRTVTIDKGVDRRLDEALISSTTTINVLVDATHGSSSTIVKLQGATVTVFASGSTTPLSRSGLTNPATTDVNGAASFPGLPDGGYRVEVSILGYTSPAPPTINASGGFQDAVFHLRSIDRPVSVRIVSQAAATEGIPSIPVTFTPTSASPGRPTVSNVVTGSSGLANTTLPHGTYTVTIGTAAAPAPPALPPPAHGTTLVASGLVVAATATPDPLSGLDFQIQEALVTGSVAVEGGTPTAIRVRAIDGTNPDGTTVRETRILSAAGTFRFFVPAATQIVYVADVEGDASWIRANQVTTSGANGSTTALPSTLTIRKRGAATILITDQTGAALPGASVVLNSVTMTSGADGTVEYTGLAPANYVVTASKTGYVDTDTSPHTITIAAGDTAGGAAAPDLTIDLTQTGSTRLLITDVADDSPLRNADVTLGGVTVTTGANGIAEFLNRPAGTYTVSVTRNAYVSQPAVSVTITGGQAVVAGGNQTIALTHN